MDAGHPQLRLVGSRVNLRNDWLGSARFTPGDEAASSVARENRRAATNPALEPTDPRWVLAVRAYSQLQGTTLTPERRRRVLKTAAQLGVRPFDANVIIAIVQDHARNGRTLANAAPTLKLLQEPHSARDSAVTIRWLAALTAAAALNLLLIWWVVSG